MENQGISQATGCEERYVGDVVETSVREYDIWLELFAVSQKISPTITTIPNNAMLLISLDILHPLLNKSALKYIPKCL
ncbi:MAG: hypothetical protein LBG59_02115 [Candidatus Peribacteria bacterium]|nr:hypothetical protein [Candidatus Peribacteria bacterium]